MPTPRNYAAEILAEPSRERRAQLLARCPQELRDLVEEHVRSAFAKVQAYRQHLQGRRAAAQQRPPAAPRQGDCPNITQHARSAPDVGRHHLAALRAVVGAEGRV